MALGRHQQGAWTVKGAPRPKKALGQNFLTDRGIIARIADAAGVGPEDAVLEVGPGRGALTRLLVERAGLVTAVEFDRQLAPLLRKEFAAADNFRLVEGDILEVDLASLLTGLHPGKWKVVANLPYNISTPVLFRFLDNKELFSRLTLMLQKEVGDRLAASPDCRDYGVLSVLFQLHYDVSRQILVKPGAFFPAPAVDSVVLRFEPLSAPRAEVGDEGVFRSVVKAAFSMRRKTLWNCLKGLSGISTDELAALLAACGIDPARRGETLSIDEFARISRALPRGVAD